MDLKEYVFLALFVFSHQCGVDKESILINSGNSTITIMKNESFYLIYYMNSGVNESTLTYSTPIENDFYLTYDTDFKVNFRNVTREGIGQVELSPLFLGCALLFYIHFLDLFTAIFIVVW